MKTAQSIISHISNQPQFRLLKTNRCYKKYISLLSKPHQLGVAFVYIRDNTLFIAVKHPAFKMELDYNKDLLISLLKTLHRYDENCPMMKANKVVVFKSKFYTSQDKEVKDTIPYYRERANGYFKMPKDNDIKDKFEKIKESILCKR